MLSTLRDLVAPLSEAEFLTHFRDRTVAFVPTSGSPRFETLLDWEELNNLVESGLYPVERLHVRTESMSIPTGFYLEEGRIVPAAFSSLMDKGASVVFHRLDKYVPRLWKLCQQIAEQTGERVTAEATVTSGKDGVLANRLNAEDICVLQIAGSMRWQLSGPQGQAVHSDRNAPLRPSPCTDPLLDEELCAGDFLFVPAGYWHRCENGAGRSLHVCIAFEPPCGLDVLTSLTSQLATDERFNGPLTRYADTTALAAHEAALKARLIDYVQTWSLADFLEETAAARLKAVGIAIEGGQKAGQDPKA